MIAPILITGAARSGTSMVAGIVNISGAFGGKMSGPTTNNRRGMFENSYIRNNVVKPILRELGYDPMGQHPLPNLSECSERLIQMAPRVRHRVVEAFGEQGYTSGSWFYKGAKMCLLWPLWAEAFPEASWIIVRRSDRGVIGSCLRTGFMRAYRDEAGWRRWLMEHKNRFIEMSQSGMKIYELSSDEIVAGDLRVAEYVMGKLNLTWREDAVREFVTPRLWHFRNDGDGAN